MKQTKICPQCKNTFATYLERQKFCSQKCKNDDLREQKFARLKLGEKIDPRQAKRYLLTIGPEQCWVCGWNKINPVTNKCPVEMDHIDGDSENNRVDNLRLLCPNCHSLTPTFRNLNRGKGRHKRRERYRAGQSY